MLFTSSERLANSVMNERMSEQKECTLTKVGDASAARERGSIADARQKKEAALQPAKSANPCRSSPASLNNHINSAF